jgi:predicted dehydrogenase
MEQIRIGLAGLGHRGVWWSTLLQKIPGFRITALYDYIQPLHERALANIPYRQDVKSFTDWKEFLSFRGMDAVALVVRSPRQGAMAAEALRSGFHVNAEVPAAHTMEDCHAIVKAQKESGKVYQLAEQVRFGGFVEAWRKMVAAGQLGHINYGEGQYVGYYGTRYFFQDPATGRQCEVHELKDYPNAKPTWLHEMPPIQYLVHDLSPALKVLDDRVVEVMGASTSGPSRAHPEVRQPDIQVALARTAKGTLLRFLCGWASPGPHDDHHWWQFMGTKGRLEWRRRRSEKPRFWLAGTQMHEMSDVDWRFEREDAPPEAVSSGHNDLDYYVHAAFRDAVLHGKPVELNAVNGVHTAAVGILAAESIEQGGKWMKVPEF